MGFRRRSFVAIGLVWTLALITCLDAQAQRSKEEFGKNRIQFRQFDWQYLSGENFDVYYYDARKGVAQEALEFLESEFDRITDQIDSRLILRPRFFCTTRLLIYVKATSG